MRERLGEKERGETDRQIWWDVETTLVANERSELMRSVTSREIGIFFLVLTMDVLFELSFFRPMSVVL